VGCAADTGGRLRAGVGTTDLRIGPELVPRVVDGLLTGIHEPGTSHFDLLQAFASADLLAAAHRHAEAAGYLGHEFGDVSLILAGQAAPAA
jgi:S-adenosylmethionine:tRNA ribosyltransferase-isomerase